ncbi:probable NAD(P)H dehydrogenase subunit CRR3, chloroplastic [Punica granatum]|uniref:Uncharacterized protein n=2 Tax=Punica granatum TaxID=22663 RepID=A0A218WWN4_PUNGR|nr:probable NAD(P)H dehydrogenase subunit CRR3, chloroplastic [Punica granatum]XP_031389112.1 probable NAD(P)H dehydrogenase subunit CRR3, chloroplastic [Punica granatum]XP_031389113.1 probable NAD(P)H dehydrogenase subunit CRR3, chloroplastic [Punica granatum]XP_031389114.1 probable NAD(P)H dehydrogenase subunit CRR3, chloroplastic [Punica granatum]XP_031389115.1 probable NAD(P)H dehydrogenase subunit CRR3, chloroplastic [Punica granatum]OWM76611.1 hypothetical protein CDL15_Pgr009176 [Punica
MNCYCCSLSSSYSSIYVASRTSLLASLADDHSLRSTRPSSSPPETPPIPRRLSRSRTRQDWQPKKSTQQPTVIQIERAIGTGVFRDNDPLEFEERRSVLDGIIPGSSRKFETAVERKFRETGEWLVRESERRSNSSGKGILVAVFQWILPTWILLLLVTSGIMKLPFDIPLLNDLIM